MQFASQNFGYPIKLGQNSFDERYVVMEMKIVGRPVMKLFFISLVICLVFANPHMAQSEEDKKNSVKEGLQIFKDIVGSMTEKQSSDGTSSQEQELNQLNNVMDTISEKVEASDKSGKASEGLNIFKDIMSTLTQGASSQNNQNVASPDIEQERASLLPINAKPQAAEENEGLDKNAPIEQQVKDQGGQEQRQVLEAFLQKPSNDECVSLKATGKPSEVQGFRIKNIGFGFTILTSHKILLCEDFVLKSGLLQPEEFDLDKFYDSPRLTYERSDGKTQQTINLDFTSKVLSLDSRLIRQIRYSQEFLGDAPNWETVKNIVMRKFGQPVEIPPNSDNQLSYSQNEGEICSCGLKVYGQELADAKTFRMQLFSDYQKYVDKKNLEHGLASSPTAQIDF